MLAWNIVGDSWIGNGFRIDRVTPGLWSLQEVDDSAVSTHVEPIAQLPTLAACRHKAEALHRAQTLGMLRQRLGAVALGGWALALLSMHPVLVVVAAVVGSAALLELAMTWFEEGIGGAKELVQ